MPPDIAGQIEADNLIARHGTEAIGALVTRISDAVRQCDDQAVRELDLILQLVEARLEAPWRIPIGGVGIAQKKGAPEGAPQASLAG